MANDDNAKFDQCVANAAIAAARATQIIREKATSLKQAEQTFTESPGKDLYDQDKSGYGASEGNIPSLSGAGIGGIVFEKCFYENKSPNITYPALNTNGVPKKSRIIQQ